MSPTLLGQQVKFLLKIAQDGLKLLFFIFLSYEKKYFYPVPEEIHKERIVLMNCVKNYLKIFSMKLCANLHTRRKGSSLPCKNSTNQIFNFASSKLVYLRNISLITYSTLRK